MSAVVLRREAGSLCQPLLLRRLLPGIGRIPDVGALTRYNEQTFISNRIMTRFSQLFLCILTLTGTQSACAQDVQFTRDVRPILSNSCFQCHGPDENSRQAELRLDQRASLFSSRDGGAIIVPGNPQLSLLLQRVRSHDSDLIMPPEDANKPLTDDQKQILERWIRQGAPWEEHWSFIPPRRPRVPATQAWAATSIDAFVLQRLRASGLSPSPQAGPYTLVRRVYLDLTGLQPEPDEAEQWVYRLTEQSGSNESQSIDERVWQELITHLLQSPAYGERWARRWLDLARYADTNGYEKDRDRSMWPYRDWVVTAINSGMPFDRFTVEQLAGDMLPNATIEQRIATGFHRNTMLNEEGGIDPLEFRFHAMTDRVATTGTTWLGLTLGCCQCHTHKYDPVSHHEYYQVMAFLNNCDEPALQLTNDSLLQRARANRHAADRLEASLVSHWPLNSFQALPAKVTLYSADGMQNLKEAEDGFIEVEGEDPDRAVYTTELEVPAGDIYAIRINTRAVGGAGAGRTEHGNFVLTDVDVAVLPNGKGEAVELPLVSATATTEQKNYPAERAIDNDPKSGWGIHGADGIPPKASLTALVDRSRVPQDGDVIRLRVRLSQQLGDGHTIAAWQVEVLTADQGAKQKRDSEIAAAFAAWRMSERPHAVDWKPLMPVRAESNLPILTIQEDASVFASGDTAKRDDYFITLPAQPFPITSLRLEALPDERLPKGGPGSTYYEGTLGDFYLTEISLSAAGRNLPFRRGTETYRKNRYGPAVSAALAIDGDVQTGWSVHGRQGERHVAVFNLEEPVPANQEFRVQMTFGRHFASSLGRFRFSATGAETAPDAREYSDRIAGLIRSESSHSDLQTQFLMQASQLKSVAAKIRELRKPPAFNETLVLAERPRGHERPTFRHHRGEYLQPRDPVSAQLPQVLTGRNGKSPRNRLEFARWIVSRDNPLTARVIVNRHWQAFFGAGIVATVEDFGLQGQAPSHPELLDWLAVTLMEDDHWDLKALHRRIVSSSVYRQGTVVVDHAKQVDPANRLLSYSPRFRLDAEIIRDQVLQAAGVLSRKMGGPPIRPLQAAGISEAAYGKPKWNASPGDERYRRSLYTYTKRTAPYAMFATFDGPSGEACTARRNRSNSPLQALTLLNDVMLMDLVRHAGRFINELDAESDEQKLDQLFRRVLVRPASKSERMDLLEFIAVQRAALKKSPESAGRLMGQAGGGPENIEPAVWMLVARSLFALDETLSRE